MTGRETRTTQRETAEQRNTRPKAKENTLKNNMLFLELNVDD